MPPKEDVGLVRPTAHVSVGQPRHPAWRLFVPSQPCLLVLSSLVSLDSPSDFDHSFVRPTAQVSVGQPCSTRLCLVRLYIRDVAQRLVKRALFSWGGALAFPLPFVVALGPRRHLAEADRRKAPQTPLAIPARVAPFDLLRVTCV
jgi:hypothetical protein